jgi:hypothetical protein
MKRSKNEILLNEGAISKYATSIALVVCKTTTFAV